jgi:hypothetical protein
MQDIDLPGFPVEDSGFDELHAPFLAERRTLGFVRCCVAGNPGLPGFPVEHAGLWDGERVALPTFALQEIRVRLAWLGK